MTRSKILILALSVLLLASTPHKAFALFGLGGDKEQSSEFPIQDEESFKANTRAFHHIPFNNPKYEFDILLPADWKPETIAKVMDATRRQDIPEDIARFKSPMIGVGQAIITIQALRLPHEISTTDWLRNYAISNGYTLEKDVDVTGKKKASISFVSVFELKSTHTYMAAQINGDTLILARFDIPLYLKEPVGFLQKRAIDSFRLILANDDPVERQKEYALSDALRFSYPESWAMHYPDFKDINNMSVQIHNETPGRNVDGLIRFIAVHRNAQTSLVQEMATLKKYFNELLGLEFKKLISSDKAPVSGNRFAFSRYEIYQVSSKKTNVSDQEVRLAVLGDKDWYIMIVLITPREQDNLYEWARNKATFDLILKNLK